MSAPSLPLLPRGSPAPALPILRQPDAAQRLVAVGRSEILDAVPAGVFDRVADLAARIFAVPVATVTIGGEQWSWFNARHRLGDDRIGEIPRDSGLCASAVLRPDPYLVAAATDPRMLDNPVVRDALGLRFYAAAPIITTGGYRLGTVNVIDQQPRRLDPAERAVLAGLAAVVAGELELRLSAMRTLAAERRRSVRLEREKGLLRRVAALEAKLAVQVQHALEHRVVIEQAKGVLMATEGLTPQAAFERMRSLAWSGRRPVEEIAAKVLAGDPLSTHPTGQTAPHPAPDTHDPAPAQ